MELGIAINESGINNVMARILRKGMDTTGMLNIVGERMIRQTDDRFTAQKDPESRPWKPLKPATLKRKKSRLILTESHQLRDSIRYQVSGPVLRVGTNKVYGAIHQLGGGIKQGARSELFIRNRGDSGRFARGTLAGRGFTFRERTFTMPARPYLGVSKEDSADIVEVLTDWMNIK